MVTSCGSSCRPIQGSSTVQNFSVTLTKVTHHETIDQALFAKPAS